jgi:hypothetical protein
MLQHEDDLRAGLRQIRCVRHLRHEHLEVEVYAVIGEMTDVAANLGNGDEIPPSDEAVLRVLVPMQLHARAANERVA